MNPEVKLRWLSLLRSGDYHQSYDMLLDASNCCGITTKKVPRYSALGLLLVAIDFNMKTYNMKNTKLPETALETSMISRATEAEIIELQEIYEFDEIADWVEENL